MSSEPPAFLPPELYFASLARKVMGAAALFTDDAGRVLLVDPVYRDTWGMPGGAVEADESPAAACRREVAEELGLDRPAGRLLVVDWIPPGRERPEGLILIYDGGVLSAADIDAIILPPEELGGFAFVPPDQVTPLVSPPLARRIEASLEAAATGAAASLEDGYRTP